MFILVSGNKDLLSFVLRHDRLVTARVIVTRIMCLRKQWALSLSNHYKGNSPSISKFSESADARSHFCFKMCVCDTRLTKTRLLKNTMHIQEFKTPPKTNKQKSLFCTIFSLFLYNPVVTFMSGSSVLVVGGILSDLAWHIGHRMCIAVKCQESIIIPSCLNC